MDIEEKVDVLVDLLENKAIKLSVEFDNDELDSLRDFLQELLEDKEGL